ncbi:MAG: hypothetical protein BWY70_01920 [Bacteroidetes bacterium ADurb.Bin408]|nr:MAG: hypothetical protein BWY70_01920 [Bacteroidetes bacterium ADurb.Bin408]
MTPACQEARLVKPEIIHTCMSNADAFVFDVTHIILAEDNRRGISSKLNFPDGCIGNVHRKVKHIAFCKPEVICLAAVVFHRKRRLDEWHRELLGHSSKADKN